MSAELRLECRKRSWLPAGCVEPAPRLCNLQRRERKTSTSRQTAALPARPGPVQSQAAPRGGQSGVRSAGSGGRQVSGRGARGTRCGAGTRRKGGNLEAGRGAAPRFRRPAARLRRAEPPLLPAAWRSGAGWARGTCSWEAALPAAGPRRRAAASPCTWAWRIPARRPSAPHGAAQPAWPRPPAAPIGPEGARVFTDSPTTQCSLVSFPRLLSIGWPEPMRSVTRQGETGAVPGRAGRGQACGRPRRSAGINGGGRALVSGPRRPGPPRPSRERARSPRLFASSPPGSCGSGRPCGFPCRAASARLSPPLFWQLGARGGHQAHRPRVRAPDLLGAGGAEPGHGREGTGREQPGRRSDQHR